MESIKTRDYKPNIPSYNWEVRVLSISYIHFPNPTVTQNVKPHQRPQFFNTRTTLRIAGPHRSPRNSSTDSRSARVAPSTSLRPLFGPDLTRKLICQFLRLLPNTRTICPIKPGVCLGTIEYETGGECARRIRRYYP